MPPLELDIRVDLEAEPWSDIDPATITHGIAIRVGVLPDGADAGPTVAILVELDNGRCAMAETTLTLAKVAAAAIGEAWPA